MACRNSRRRGGGKYDGMNNQDNAENSQKANTRQHAFSLVLPSRLRSIVQYKQKDKSSQKTVIIIGQGGKSTGKYKHFLNIMDTETKEQYGTVLTGEICRRVESNRFRSISHNWIQVR